MSDTVPTPDSSDPAPPWGWTKFPTVTGQQFVAIPGEMWIGSVNIGRDDPERGRRVSVWKGGSVYTLWECDFEKWGFRFKQIDWPVNPLKPV